MDDAKVVGSAKYRKRRRMAGDATDDDEHEAVGLDAWGVSDDTDEEGEEGNVDYVRFGIDDATWKWVFRMYNCPGRVRFVRVPNRKTKTLMAVTSTYCEPGSVIHNDG